MRHLQAPNEKGTGASLALYNVSCIFFDNCHYFSYSVAVRLYSLQLDQILRFSVEINTHSFNQLLDIFKLTAHNINKLSIYFYLNKSLFIYFTFSLS